MYNLVEYISELFCEASTRNGQDINLIAPTEASERVTFTSWVQKYESQGVPDLQDP